MTFRSRKRCAPRLHAAADAWRLVAVLAITTVAIASAPAGTAAQEPPPAITEALELFAAGDLAGAIRLVEDLCNDDDAPEAAFALLGSLYVEAGSMERAAEVLEPLASREAADPGVLYNAGRAAEALGQIQDAGNHYRRSLEIQPGSPALRALGMLLGRIGRPGEAYVFLQPWAAANPDDMEARMAAAAGAIALERVPDAEILLQDLPAADPGIRMLRAQVLLQQEDPWGAINELHPLVDEPPEAIEGAVRRTLARAYLVVGDAEAALEQIQAVETQGAEDAVLLASARFQAGQLDAAIEALAPYAEPLPENPPPEHAPPVARDVVLEYGRYLHSAGEPGRALPFLRLATELAPETPDAYQALGQALAAMGERQEAREVLARFRELSARATNEVDSVNRMRRDIADPTGREIRAALKLAADGGVEEALAVLGREARLAPGDPRPAYAASSLLLDAGRVEEALAAADRALDAAPGRADGLYQRGAVLMSLERLAEAAEMFRQALEAQSDHAATLSDYAVLLLSDNRDDEARRLLTRLVELRPEDSTARAHLDRLGGPVEAGPNHGGEDWARDGREHLEEGNFEDAERLLRRAVAAAPAEASLRTDLASALWENNKPAEAELHAREAVDLLPSAPGGHRLLGALLLWRGEHARAAESLERAAELATPGAPLLIELGRAWSGAAGEATDATEARRRLTLAEAAWRRAVSLAPESNEAAYGLAQVLQRLGREEEATAEMERYRRLYEEDQRATRERGLAAAEDPGDGN